MKTIEQYVSIWNNGDIPGLPNVFLDEANYWDAMQEGNAIEVLNESIKATHEAFPDVTFETLSLLPTSENQVMLEWRMRATNTGKKIEINGLDAITFEKDKISEIKSYYDTSQLTQ